jgi:hypothetical protein
VFGAEQILFGTDWGAALPVVPVIENLEHSPISDDDRGKIFRRSARSLLAPKGVAVEPRPVSPGHPAGENADAAPRGFTFAPMWLPVAT